MISFPWYNSNVKSEVGNPTTSRSSVYCYNVLVQLAFGRNNRRYPKGRRIHRKSYGQYDDINKLL